MMVVLGVPQSLYRLHDRDAAAGERLGWKKLQFDGFVAF
jgi:hypothetical protein